ncbi:uncharacterized protein PG986_014715 [Apiospora aurea]|uniref:Uncharacterized protein n=1 Tax=Apiospora aurea TaxID=335848 RepID=A0ABR1PTT3_9PEZI
MHATTIFLAVLSLAAKAMGAPSNASVERRFEGGWCGVHVHLLKQWPPDLEFSVTVKVFDAKQSYVTQGDFKARVDSVMGGSIGGNGLPKDLVFTIYLRNDSPVSFEYDNEQWESGKPRSENDHCKVGKWKHIGFLSRKLKLDMDCGFTC